MPTKPKYANPEERTAALREKASRQMLAQWQRKREVEGQDGPGYFGCHIRVRKARGRASDQTCSCGRKARHWAHTHGTDPADPQNYVAMCQKCHWSYDNVAAKSKETLGPEGRRAAAFKAWETKRSRR